MKCERCRFAPLIDSEGFQDECPAFETHGTTWKDGRDGCTLTCSRLKKMEYEYAESLGIMGTDMGFRRDLENRGFTEEKAVKIMMHMIGMYPEGRRKPYTRHGKKFFKPYRNGWGGKNEVLELANHEAFGFCHKFYSSPEQEKKDYPIYNLTRKGLDWLGRQLHIKIHDEER